MSRTITPRATLEALAKSGATADDLYVQKGLIPDTVEETGGRRCRFVISTGSVDRDNDTINADGWDLSNYIKNPVVLWAHDYRQLPVARALSVSLENGKLVSECEFADHAFADTVLAMIKGGFLKATSVGFRPKLWNFNEDRGGIDFSKQELMEYSIVPVPANPEALIDMRAAKAAGIDVEPLIAWAKGVLEPPADAKDILVQPTAEVPEPKAATCPECGANMPDGTCPTHGAPKAASVGFMQVTETTKVGDVSFTQTVTSNGSSVPTFVPIGNGTSTTGTIGGWVPVTTSAPAPEPISATLDIEINPVVRQPEHDKTCRICNQELVLTMPRLRDDLGVVCAPCFVRAAHATHAPAEPPASVTPPVEAEIVLDFDTLSLEDDGVELDESNSVLLDLNPEDLRAALQSAVTSVVGTLVRDETRAALNRARGRVD